jgi:multisubunit Na+/H+ antiporter MnhE subunit
LPLVIVLVALAVGLVFWIVAWALGLGSFDPFLVTLALLVGALAVKTVSPFVRQQFNRD